MIEKRVYIKSCWLEKKNLLFLEFRDDESDVIGVEAMNVRIFIWLKSSYKVTGIFLWKIRHDSSIIAAY